MVCVLLSRSLLVLWPDLSLANGSWVCVCSCVKVFANTSSFASYVASWNLQITSIQLPDQYRLRFLLSFLPWFWVAHHVLHPGLEISWYLLVLAYSSVPVLVDLATLVWWFAVGQVPLARAFPQNSYCFPELCGMGTQRNPLFGKVHLYKEEHICGVLACLTCAKGRLY